MKLLGLVVGSAAALWLSYWCVRIRREERRTVIRCTGGGEPRFPSELSPAEWKEGK